MTSMFPRMIPMFIKGGWEAFSDDPLSPCDAYQGLDKHRDKHGGDKHFGRCLSIIRGGRRGDAPRSGVDLRRPEGVRHLAHLGGREARHAVAVPAFTSEESPHHQTGVAFPSQVARRDKLPRNLAAGVGAFARTGVVDGEHVPIMGSLTPVLKGGCLRRCTTHDRESRARKPRTEETP